MPRELPYGVPFVSKFTFLTPFSHALVFIHTATFLILVDTRSFTGIYLQKLTLELVFMHTHWYLFTETYTLHGYLKNTRFFTDTRLFTNTRFFTNTR